MTAVALESAAAPRLAGARTSAGAIGASRRARRRSAMFGLPDRVYEEKISRFASPLGAFFVVSDPAGAKRVLVDNVANYPKTDLEKRFFVALFGKGLLGTDGELWRTHRRIMAPAFQPQAVASYALAMSETSAAFAEEWAGKIGQTLDAPGEMGRLTLRIISKTMFSTDAPEVIDPIARVMSQGFEEQNFNLLDLLPIISAFRMRARERRMAQFFRPMDFIVSRLIEERVGEPAVQDLLGRLVAAADGESGGRLTPQEVRDEVVTIYIAGHETTAVAMSWIWYLLSQHPAEEAKLHAELDAVLAGRQPTQADVEKLVYARRIADEAMRLYPPAPGLSARVARSDDEICGMRIPKGAQVGVMPWVLHRHRDLWEEPERFDPVRWAPGRAGNRHRFSYIPFGAGPRICIGQLMAINEIVLILATLAQRFRLRLAPGAEVDLKANVTLRPIGLSMVLEER